MSQPKQLSTGLPWTQANAQWAQTLNPLIANLMNQCRILSQVNLVAGANVINHGLGRVPQGWFFTDFTAGAMAYRIAPMTETTLTLMVSNPTTVNLVVF